MGFFKSIGKAIGGAVKEVAKVVSIKNAVNAVTGNYSDIANDAINRAKKAGLGVVGGIAGATGLIKTSSPTKAVSPQTQLVKAGAVATKASGVLAVKSSLIKVPAKLSTASAQFVQTQKPATTGIVALDEAINQGVEKVVNVVTDATGKILEKPVITKFQDWFAKKTLEYYWRSYKTAILVVAGLLSAFLIYWFKFRKKGGRRTR